MKALNASTIDLGLAKHCTITHVHVANGKWNGNSDHSPVLFEIEGDSQPAWGSHCISQARRSNQFCMDTAEHFFGRALPLLRQRLSECSSRCEVQECYSLLQDTFQFPWTDQGHRPPRFRYFWNRALEHLAKARDRLRTRARRSDTKEDWEAFTAANQKVKRESRRLKRQCAQKDFHNLAHSSPDKANAFLATALRNERRNVVQTNDASKAMKPAEFTQFLVGQ